MTRLRRALALLLSACLLCGGCHSLAEGRLDAVDGDDAAARPGTVVLIRGWEDLYSEGIDQLAAELRRAGAPAEAYRESQWKAVAEALRKRAGRGASRGPLVLIGFSYGADDVLRVAEALQSSGSRLDLVITIDPVTPPPVPANVRVCYNYFQTNGVWDVFPWLRGVPLESAGGGLVNVDLRRERPDLVEPDTAHSNVAANPKLHREILARVLAACPPAGSGK